MVVFRTIHTGESETTQCSILRTYLQNYAPKSIYITLYGLLEYLFRVAKDLFRCVPSEGSRPHSGPPKVRQCLRGFPNRGSIAEIS